MRYRFFYIGIGVTIVSIAIILIFQMVAEQKNSIPLTIRTQTVNASGNYFNDTVISKAVNLAENSSQFQSIVGRSYTLDSVFGELDHVHNQTLDAYGVAFSFSNENPCSKDGLTMNADTPDENPGFGTVIQDEVVVFENSNLTKVLGAGQYRASCFTGINMPSCLNQTISNSPECGGFSFDGQTIVLPSKKDLGNNEQ